MIKILKFPRISIPASFFILTIVSLIGCNKQELETGVEFVQGTSSTVFSSTVTEITFGNSGRGYLISGNRKKIYKTTDYGVTWAICTTFTGSSAFVDHLRYTNNGGVPFLVYHPSTSGNAQLFCNTSGGNTWLDQIVSSGSAIYPGFYLSSSGYAYIKLPTYNYCLAQTTNFGDSYNYIAPAPAIGSLFQFTSVTQGCAITTNDDFIITNDGGLNWTTTHSNCYRCTKISPGGVCFMIGWDYKIYKSTDFGATWNVCFSDPAGDYYTAVDYKDSGLVVIAAQGHLLCSRDAGVTWKYLKFESESTLLSNVLILADGSVIGTAGNTVSTYTIPDPL